MHWLQITTVAECAAFVLVAVSLGALAIRTLWLAWKSRNWPTVDGEMKGASIEELVEGPGYKVRVRYSYSISGSEHYAGERFAFGRDTPMFEFLSSAERFVAEKCQAGERVAVYYDPGDPSRAVLEPGLRMDHIGVLSALVILGCLAALAYELLKIDGS